MPTYLCHGFRWHRRDLRVYVILNDIEDAASNWVVGSATSFAILSHFHARFDFLPEPAPLPLDIVVNPRPSTGSREQRRQPRSHDDDDFTVPASLVPESRDPVLANSWSAVKLLEEFDPEDTRMPSRPYAYVADYVVRVDLSANVVDEMAKYRMRQQDEWFPRLRDELQKGEDIRWYVVVCGDDVREVPAGSGDEATCNDDIDYDSEDDDVDEYVGNSDDHGSTPAETPSQGLNLSPIEPLPAKPIQQERPRTSPGPSNLPLRPSPLSSHPPLPNPPAEPGGQKPPARPPLKNKKSMAEGLRRLFGKKDSVSGPR